MDRTIDIAFGYRVSRDGRSIALDWQQPDGSTVTNFLPVDDLPALMSLLLNAAIDASDRAPAAAGRPVIGPVLQSTDIQIVAPDDGTDWVLRVRFGRVHLDLAITRHRAEAMQRTIARSPQLARRLMSVH